MFFVSPKKKPGASQKKHIGKIDATWTWNMDMIGVFLGDVLSLFTMLYAVSGKKLDVEKTTSHIFCDMWKVVGYFLLQAIMVILKFIRTLSWQLSRQMWGVVLLLLMQEKPQKSRFSLSISIVRVLILIILVGGRIGPPSTARERFLFFQISSQRRFQGEECSVFGGSFGIWNMQVPFFEVSRGVLYYPLVN